MAEIISDVREPIAEAGPPLDEAQDRRRQIKVRRERPPGSGGFSRRGTVEPCSSAVEEASDVLLITLALGGSENVTRGERGEGWRSVSVPLC